MLTAQEKEINGVVYKVAPFTGAEPFKLKATLLRLFGPAIGKALGSLTNSPSLKDIKVESNTIADAISTLFEQLDEDTYWNLIKRILRSTIAIVGESANGQKQAVDFSKGNDQDFTIVFQGRVFDIYQIIYFILQVNYPDFFVLMQEKLGGFLRKTTASLKEQGMSEPGK